METETPARSATSASVARAVVTPPAGSAGIPARVVLVELRGGSAEVGARAEVRRARRPGPRAVLGSALGPCAVDRLLAEPGARARALGEALSEPKPGTWFERADGATLGAGGIALDRRTRMLYDDRFVFINGEAYRAAGRDATLMRRLADARHLDAASVAGAGAAARALLAEWLSAGWCVTGPEFDDEETT